MQQAVLQAGADDHDVVGKLEATLERAGGDALVQDLALRGLIGRLLAGLGGGLSRVVQRMGAGLYGEFGLG